MPAVTIVLPETLAERLRKTVRERYAGKRGAMSRIIAEALEAQLARTESSFQSETFRALKGKKVVAEASSLAELADRVREKGLSPRGLLIVSSRKLEASARAGFRAKAA